MYGAIKGLNMSNWSDFEKYVMTKLDKLEEDIAEMDKKNETRFSSIDRKVSGIRSKIAMVSTFITAILTGAAHYISKKLDL